MDDKGPAEPRRGQASSVQLRSLLAALGVLAAEQWAPGRVQQLLHLSVQILDAEYAVLAVDGDAGQVEPVLFSTADGVAVEALRELLGAHLEPVPLPTAEAFRASAIAVSEGSSGGVVRPALQVPMSISSGQTGRLFVVGRTDSEPFTAVDEEVVSEFAKMAALAVENALQSEASRQQVRWLKSLTLITQALMQAGPDEMAVWQEIADRVHQLASTRTVTISTISDDDPELLEVRVAAGVGVDELPGHLYPALDSLSARAITAGTWQVSSGVDGHTAHHVMGPLGPTLAIPLFAGDRPRGAIVLSRDPGQAPFDRTTIVMVNDFANQAMLAVELAETRAAEKSLASRTEIEEVTGTFQDRTIQRLYGATLAVEAAMARRPEPWLEVLHAELAGIMSDARISLDFQYGRDHQPDR
jgi:GAF domain-containing protein